MLRQTRHLLKLVNMDFIQQKAQIVAGATNKSGSSYLLKFAACDIDVYLYLLQIKGFVFLINESQTEKIVINNIDI